MNPKTTQVFICNMSEDVWPFISSLEDKRVKLFETNENANMSDWNIFSFAAGSPAVFVTPRPLSGEFLSYAQSLIGLKHIRVLSPRRHSGETSKDALSDRRVFSELVSIGKKHTLSLSAYSPSFQLYALAQALVRHGARVVFTNVPAPQHRWASDFFGSKIGIRQMTDLPMAEGYICTNTKNATHIASMLYQEHGGVVIKTNKGHSGFGVDIFRPGELPADPILRVKKLKLWLARNMFWEKFPIVVEAYKKENTKIAGGFPSIECKVRRDGTVEYLYYCGMRMTEDGTFRGMEIHEGLVPDRMLRAMKALGQAIGKKLSTSGYRGYFDVDLLAAQDKKLYVTESNVRRTGGTYVYHLALRLFGKDFMRKTYIISRNSYPLPHARTFIQLRDLFGPILYDKKTKEGLILTSEHMMLQRAMGYVIFGRTKKRAVAIEAKMEELIQ